MAENKMELYCKLPIPITVYQTDKEMNIETLEGVMHANVGDYIITGVNGEQYPCKPDIFAKTYIKYGQENKMEQVAAMFGKKLGEVFSVEFLNGSLGRNRNFASCCYFKADGLFCEDRGPCEIMLNDLLTGKAAIAND